MPPLLKAKQRVEEMVQDTDGLMDVQGLPWVGAESIATPVPYVCILDKPIFKDPMNFIPLWFYHTSAL